VVSKRIFGEKAGIAKATDQSRNSKAAFSQISPRDVRKSENIGDPKFKVDIVQANRI